MAETYDYDAIVVGSGISGGWAAKELTERGLRTLVLEAGGPIDPAFDYVEHVQPWEMHFRGMGDQKLMARDYPVQREWASEMTAKFFVNDRENPYTRPEDAPFEWIRGRQVGGRSLMWGRQVYRWSELDFEANAKDGHGNDWPLRYRDVAPWYTHVEQFIGVSGAREGLAHLPDGSFLPPMAMTRVEREVRAKLMKSFGGERVMTIGRCAVLTQNHNGRLACHYCGPCSRGCVTHSYFNSVGSTLPAARRTGLLTLRPHSVVAEVLYDAKRGRARGVRVIDAQRRFEREYSARVVFLCASAFESVRILLNSRPGDFPEGLGNSGGLLGRYAMDHMIGPGAAGVYPGHTDVRTTGIRPNGIYLARFRNVKAPHKEFLRGYGMQGGSSRLGWNRGGSTVGHGAAFKAALSYDLGAWRMSLNGFGEMLPHAENRVTLDPVVTDKWGIPAARIDVRHRENDLAMARDMSASAAEMLEAAGVVNVQMRTRLSMPGHAIHEMGGARMGKTAAEGVVNRWNQVWDAKNVFVTDGACMASSACQNPSITYMALTARAAARAVGLLNRREL